MIKRTLYFSNPVALKSRQRQLLVYDSDNELIGKVPFEDIGLVVLENAMITISQNVVNSLLSNTSVIIWCDEKHMPSGLLQPIVGNSTLTENARIQIECSEPLKKQAWKLTIQAKIRNQAALLKINQLNYEPLLHWSKEVNSGDTRNLEARAAHYYWKELFNEFKDFNRGQYEDPPNNFLNYGYAILRAVVARSLCSTGLICAIGIHHRNKYNPFCLADDVMEPYRPFVDRLVVEILRNHSESELNLTKEIKAKLLTIPVLDTIIDDLSSPLMIATQRTTASLLKFFNGETRVINYPDLWKSAVIPA